MVSAQEASGARTQLAGDLAAGLETLSLDQQVTFTQYKRVVLPADGFVFWVRADLLGPSAIYDGAPLDRAKFNQGPVMTPAPTMTATGSLHWSVARAQREADNVSQNQVIFTSEVQVDFFNQVGPNVIWIARLPQAANTRYAFSGRGRFYIQAQLYHYVGATVDATMASQIIDSPLDFVNIQPVVSNSLPLWLALNGYSSVAGGLFPLPFTLYPSMAVPDNLTPPYGVVHVLPDRTRALAFAPTLDASLSHDQLARDDVRVTLFGLRNADALGFLDAVNQYSLDTDAIGLMNSPIPRDEKAGQLEFMTLAMKKVLDFEVSYHQSTVRAVSRQIISQAIVNYGLSAL
jgi:hypothetical protein